MPRRALSTHAVEGYAAARRREIDPNRAARDYQAFDARRRQQPAIEPHAEARGDTIYLTAADRHGNVVSLIQSIYESFGAGIVAGETGIVLHNRGSQFSLTPSHPNVLAPGKRPFHTLVPAMVLKDGRPWLSFGVMGGDMQPQGHVQVLLNLIDFGMNIQEAGEAPRFRHSATGLALESAIAPEARFGLDARGHRLISSVGAFGGFQGILIHPTSGCPDGRLGSTEGWPGDRILKFIKAEEIPEGLIAAVRLIVLPVRLMHRRTREAIMQAHQVRTALGLVTAVRTVLAFGIVRGLIARRRRLLRQGPPATPTTVTGVASSSGLPNRSRQVLPPNSPLREQKERWLVGGCDIPRSSGAPATRARSRWTAAVWRRPSRLANLASLPGTTAGALRQSCWRCDPGHTG